MYTTAAEIEDENHQFKEKWTFQYVKIMLI